MNNSRHVERVRVLSRRLRWAVRALIALVAIGTVGVLIAALFGAEASAIIDVGRETVPWEDLSTAGRLGVVVILGPMVVLVVAVLWLSDLLLGLYEAGVIFSRDNGRLIRRIGQLIVALSLLGTVVEPALVALMVSQGVFESSHYSIEPEIGLLFVGIWILVVGHVTELGAEMAEESALTI